MRIAILFILFSFSIIVHAQSAQLADLEFRSVHLGQAPTEEMICVRGPCLSEEIKSRLSIIPGYKLPVDITHYGGVEISSPKYDFFKNQLFQIRFQLTCDADEAEACIESVVQKLNTQYGLAQVTDTFEESSDIQAIHFDQYITDTGAVVDVIWGKSLGKWGHPSIKIYEKSLIDALRIFANPDYMPKELTRVTSNEN